MRGMKRFGSMLWPMLMLAPDNGGASGGAGDGDGGADGGAEKPMSRKEVEDVVAKAVGTHINSRGFQEKLRKGLASSDDVQAIRKILEDSAAARGGAGAGGEDQGQSGTASVGAGGASGGMDVETKRALAKLQRDNEDLQKMLKAMSDDKKASEQKQLESEERSAIKDGLNGKVKPSLLPAAVALLYGERKVIGRNKDGGVVFKMKDRDNFDVEATIEDGIKAWLETPEGKEYLPPADIGGSGDPKSPRGNRGPASGLESSDKNVRSNAAANVLFG
jgi:hypothetical protein